MREARKHAVLVHGFLQPGTEPEKQLGSIRALCERRGYAVAVYVWAESSGEGVRRELRLLRSANESFLDTHASDFDLWFNGFRDKVAQGDQITILGYSGGGSFLYHWVSAMQGSLEQVSSIITIASPLKFPPEIYFEDRPQRPVYIRNEKKIEINTLVKQFTIQDVHLYSLLGDCDPTVLPSMSRFDSDAEAVGSSYVVQEAVALATHSSILVREAAINKVDEWLQGV